MKIQQSTLKVNGINGLGFFIISSLATSSVFGSVHIIKLVDTPLTINSFPIQKGTANSTFSFNLSPYISRLKTEVNYRVTNNYNATLSRNKVFTVINGLTPVHSGEGVCSKEFSLLPKQSCILRFNVDKTQYKRSFMRDPIVAANIPDGVSGALLGEHLDNVVPKLPDATKVMINQNSLPPGFKFNPDSLIIFGTPTKPGTYSLMVNATNGTETAAPRELKFEIQVDLKDKPKFKTNYNIPSAMPDQEYSINLMNLIESNKSFMVTNQVTFRIDTTHNFPTWLKIDPNNTRILKGLVPSEEAGKTKEITLFATSNTGGDSLPLTIKIPVAFDPTKKPIIDKNIKLNAVAGQAIHNDFRYNIIDPAADGNVTLQMENIEPKATWLKTSSVNPTELYGLVPEEDVGKNYLITLTASTPTGGSSDKVVIPLNIAINKDKTPRFYAANPNLPLVYVGQSYVYDFVANKDVYPEYNDIPYTIEFARDKVNPNWIRIENNKLIVEKVPENLDQIVQLFITIKNVPGGLSNVMTLELYIMN